MKKRIFAIFTAAALAVSVMTALAEYDPNKVISENEIATKTVAAPIITVNGTEIDAPDYFMKDETLMLPLRAITEALGFEIEWQGETGTIILTRGPLYITMSAFADGYTFSKTAPMTLGTAPILTEGTTFVPENFITEILDGAYAIDEAGNIKIVWGDMKDVALITGLSTEEKQITVTDIIKGEVVLNVGGETPITDEAGTPVAFEDLKEGMILKGTVRNVIDFGAFVDIGVHQDGLVHISEICDRFIKHPSEELTVGQIVTVKVITIDLGKKRIGLSIKKASEEQEKL